MVKKVNLINMDLTSIDLMPNKLLIHIKFYFQKRSIPNIERLSPPHMTLPLIGGGVNKQN